MAKMCKNCGSIINDDSATNCNNCGAFFDMGNQQTMGGYQQNGYYQQQGYQQPMGGYQQPAGGYQQNGYYPGYEPKSKIVAGLFAIFFGGLGVHNFYLGNVSRGITQIIVSFFTCGIGSIWGFIEGILILTGSINKDANGVPLAD